MEARVRQYAESLLRQYDKNKNGQLERDEAAEMRGGLRAADRNGDGIITVDELTAKLLEFGQSGPSHDPSGFGRLSSSGGSGSSYGGAGRKSFRFLSATERLPKDLPDWFARKDANEDGQVTMAEFASSWSDSVVQDFSQWDLDGDGIITPAEILRKAKEKK
jgi:Ca2+-binding EF-hand superfamily protein